MQINKKIEKKNNNSKKIQNINKQNKRKTKRLNNCWVSFLYRFEIHPRDKVVTTTEPSFLKKHVINLHNNAETKQKLPNEGLSRSVEV